MVQFGIDFATLITAIASIITFFEALGRKFTEGRAYRRARFGSIRGELYYWFSILDTEEVQKYHYKINTWSKDEARTWKENYVSKCSSIAVAAAIFATAGQASLSLNGMSDAHWSCSALMATSMALGIFSVCTAVSLQTSVIMLSDHREIRLWLSRGVSNWYDYPEPYSNLLLESSAATIKLSDVPQLFLNLSILSYFLGFGLYLLYVWMWAVVDQVTSYRNQFIFYVCIIGAVCGYIAWLWAGKVLDRDKVNLQFNLKRTFDTGEEDKKMKILDKWTEIVETLTSQRSEAEKVEARREMDDILYFMRYGFERKQPEPEDNIESVAAQRESSETAVKEVSSSQA